MSARIRLSPAELEHLAAKIRKKIDDSRMHAEMASGNLFLACTIPTISNLDCQAGNAYADTNCSIIAYFSPLTCIAAEPGGE